MEITPNKRVTAPALTNLLKEDEHQQIVLRKLVIESSTLEQADASTLNDFGQKIKKACSLYSKASRELVAHYLKHGCPTEANETRKARYQLIYGEVDETRQY